MLFSESSNVSEKDYDVILGHHHIAFPAVNNKRTVQLTTQLQAILRFPKKKASYLVTLHQANCNRRQQTA